MTLATVPTRLCHARVPAWLSYKPKRRSCRHWRPGCTYGIPPPVGRALYGVPVYNRTQTSKVKCHIWASCAS